MDNETDISKVPPVERKLHNFHHVTLVDPTKFEADLTNYLWSKVRNEDYAFDDLSRDNPTAFCLALVAPQCAHFFLGDPSRPSGWALLKGLWKFSNPDIHFVVWDKKYPVQDLKAAGKEVISWAFQTWQCNRVTAMIPVFNDAARRLAILLRFQHEGCLKQAMLFHGRWVNVDMCGLLREDFNTKVI